MTRKSSRQACDPQSQSPIADAAATNQEPPLHFIGCCGAYCRTCGVLKEGLCKGCKLGYDRGERDLAKAKCAMKACCFRDRHFETCADCPDYTECERIQAFHSHKGYKYGKYKQSVEFIRKNGYSEFLRVARAWKGPYGTLE